MFAYFDMSIGWLELAKRTFREMQKDDGFGLAAQLAYYFFLSLFPAILCAIALTSFLPLQDFTDEVIGLLGRFAPEEMLSIVEEQMIRLAGGDNGGIVSIGLLGALWSSSAALVSIIGAMNRAYDIEESRPWWKVRLTAVMLTVGLAFFVVVSFALVIAGPEIADALADELGLGGLFAWSWKIIQWPVAFALVVTGIGLIYYFAPDADQDWVWITPGSLIAAILWLLGSLGFRFYVVNFGNYEATYGAIAGVILLLLWFYLSGLVIVLGAEASAEIEHSSPWGKQPGEKSAGQRRKLGFAAARAFRERESALRPGTATHIGTS
ncbi:MAG TPA: YihY/virulence factor BrkB family protein [Vicinamibacterales bacterium]|nr:YihY/virulence factor BrkB family protein [Vicinamibacterales bacterium]